MNPYEPTGYGQRQASTVTPTPGSTPNPSAASSGEGGSSLSDDPRISAALEEYLARLNAGEQPTREEWLARYPEIAETLGACIDGLLFVHQGALNLSDRHAATVGKRFDSATVLGDFRIVREVGRGGMGVVYEAEQLSLRRRVALKVLPAAASLDPRQRQRFQVEAQSAAHLHHPHIVPVFGVGCDHEVPYYAMQYIEGQTLADVIVGLKQASDGPNHPQAIAQANADSSEDRTADFNTTPKSGSGVDVGLALIHSADSAAQVHQNREYFRYVARLGVEAAEALEHAHGLGVIHRDVKPSNLMIDRFGHLWVTDFGLARFDGEEGLTRTGDVLGTLRYTSPEQSKASRGVVDQRTDIYSLGATLYELATLRPAFDGRDRQEILSQIAREESPAPRKVNPAIPRDLETIILKAMSFDVGTRYATAQELADDLNRFLNDRSVLARRPTRLDRAAKWARRHRAAVATTTITLVVGLAIGAILLWSERSRTLQALADFRAARDRERDNMKMFFTTTDYLTMNAMGTLAARELAKEAAKDENAPQWFYRQALEAYEKLAQTYHDDRDLRLIAAEAYRRVGFVKMIMRYVNKSPEFADADAHGAYRSAIKLCDASIAEHRDDVDARNLHAAVVDDFGRMLVWLGQHDEAEPLFVRTLELQRELMVQFPDNPEMKARYNNRHSALGKFYLASGRNREAEAIFREVTKADPENGNGLNDLAWMVASDPKSSADGLKDAVDAARKAVALTPKGAAMWNTLGLALLRVGDEKGAEEAINKSMEYHRADGADWLILAMIHVARGEKAKARTRLDEASGWLQKNQVRDPILSRLVQETEAKLGAADGSGASLPAPSSAGSSPKPAAGNPPAPPAAPSNLPPARAQRLTHPQ